MDVYTTVRRAIAFHCFLMKMQITLFKAKSPGLEGGFVITGNSFKAGIICSQLGPWKRSNKATIRTRGYIITSALCIKLRSSESCTEADRRALSCHLIDLICLWGLTPRNYASYEARCTGGLRINLDHLGISNTHRNSTHGRFRASSPSKIYRFQC